MKKVLLLDNDLQYGNILSLKLRKEGYDLFVTDNPIIARQQIDTGDYIAALIDIRLQDNNDTGDDSGIIVARTLTDRIRTIMVTNYPSYEYARQALGARFDGLPPAMDFVSKHDGFEGVLKALRDAQMQPAPAQHNAKKPETPAQPAKTKPAAGDISLDIDERALVVNGETKPLTPTQYAVLAYLFENAGKTVSREELALEALDEKIYTKGSDDNRINNIILGLRKLLGETGSKHRYLISKPGHGYLLRTSSHDES